MLPKKRWNNSKLPLLSCLCVLTCSLFAGSISAAHASQAPQTAVDTQAIPVTIISAKDSENKPLPFHKIAADTYFLYGNIAEVDEKNRGFNGNAGFVVTRDGVVVIDSLGTPRLGKRLIATVRQVTKLPIKYLIITHNHPDHSYGAIAFKSIPGIKIIGHEGTLKYLDSEGLAGSVAFRRSLIAPDMKGFKGVAPDILIGGKRFDHYAFTVGGKTFRIYNTGQHHSYGDLVVHQVEDKNVWISDLAFNNRSTFMGDGHSAEVLEAMDWLRNSFPDTRLMIPGHGSAQTAPFPMVEKTYSYVKRLRDEMRDAIKSGKDLATAVKDSDFADWHDAPLYHENHKKNANFIYLEMEQELF
ncbi:MAG: MBL fold metallo-hydrolase [Gallionellaceae bacterium]|jgi:glyoxylase-like metal-dependent hydrolase (beta-lactamase superfamily II)